MGVSLAGRSDGGGGVTRGGDLRLLLPLHSREIYCDQAHYGTMSGSGEAYGITGGQAVAGTGNIGLGEYVEDGSGGGPGGGGGGYGREGDGDRLIMWEDNTANVILGTDNNAPLDYAPGS